MFTAGFADQIGKMQDQLETLEAQVADLTKWLRAAKAGKDIPLKDTSKPCHALKTSELTDDQKQARAAERHMFPRAPSADQVRDRLAQYRVRVDKHKLKMRNKDENKAVALNTSKINYMDPRIT